jgi:plasmid stabilization system protein ParE
MKKVVWQPPALLDLPRLYEFLVTVNPRTAKAALNHLEAAPRTLRAEPRLGTTLSEFSPREVRRLVVGDYELRYEIRADTAPILRLWHCHEDR